MAMRKLLGFSVLGAAASAAIAQTGAPPQGRVLSVTPAVEQVAVPRQVCSVQPVVTQSQPSGLGAVIGAVAGGVIGNSIGGGSGRAAATVLGLTGGALLGNQTEANGSTRVQNFQDCRTETSYERRTVGYDVAYEYAGHTYRTRMDSDPGAYVPLDVGVASQRNDAPPSQQAQTYSTSAPRPGVVVPSGYATAPVYVQPAPVIVAPPTYYVPAPPVAVPYYQPSYQPSYYAPSYYAPAYVAPPVGLSLNLGYSRGYGGGHWR